MTPRAVVRAARLCGLDLVGICDHNSAENVPAVVAAAEEAGLRVLGGLEVTSQEEVHVLGLFDVDDGMKALGAMQEIVHENLPGLNNEEVFGEQLVYGADGSVVGRSDRLLIGATTLALGEVVEAIRGLGGLAVASHVDREGFSIIGQLGFVPEGLPLDAMELSPRAVNRVEPLFRRAEGDLPFVAGSDAHRLDEIGSASTAFRAREASVAGLRRALGSLPAPRASRQAGAGDAPPELRLRGS
jgi:PHP family Zn ribbon phosphoesterase